MKAKMPIRWWLIINTISNTPTSLAAIVKKLDDPILDKKKVETSLQNMIQKNLVEGTTTGKGGTAQFYVLTQFGKNVVKGFDHSNPTAHHYHIFKLIGEIADSSAINWRPNLGRRMGVA